MGYIDDSILVSSHTLATILKSKLLDLVIALIPLSRLKRILLTSIRNLGACPCPRCLIPLARVHNLGMARDVSQRTTLMRIDNARRRNNVATARQLIYEKNYLVNSAAVEDLLKPESLVPTSVCSGLSHRRLGANCLKNAFSDRLSALGFNLFSIFLIDLMHEFELGSWRALFIHLLRMLESIDSNLLTELDRR